MGDLTGPPPEKGGRDALRRDRERFRREVASQEARQRRFRREGVKGFWFGLASFGMVGWSIAVPTLLGVALGLWLDARLGGGTRYTLSLLVAGIVLGGLNVWRWLRLQEEAEGGPDGETGAAGSSGTAEEDDDMARRGGRTG
ncbi:MAG: AtpZ/AtpI family protein [Firmicutes bacterium]|nr:AtpZ/AtpI family protein [Bacillota bacterium]